MPMPSHYSDIIRRVITGTNSGKVRWEEFAPSRPREQRYMAWLDDVGLTVLAWADESTDEVDKIRVELMNDEADVVDDFTVYGDEEMFRVVDRLLDIARRSARDIDKHLAKIRAKLPDPDDDIPF